MNEPEANEKRTGRFQLSLKTLFLLLFCTSTWFAHWQYEMRTEQVNDSLFPLYAYSAELPPHYGRNSLYLKNVRDPFDSKTDRWRVHLPSDFRFELVTRVFLRNGVYQSSRAGDVVARTPLPPDSEFIEIRISGTKSVTYPEPPEEVDPVMHLCVDDIELEEVTLNVQGWLQTSQRSYFGALDPIMPRVLLTVGKYEVSVERVVEEKAVDR